MAADDARVSGPLSGFVAILLKEFVHIRRERSTIIFSLVIPVLQLTIFGYAINTKIEHIATAVFDLDRRQASRELIDAFANSRTFRIVERVESLDAVERAIAAGRVKVGIVIPPNFSDQLLRGRQATFQVLIDGSDSQSAITALNTTNLLGMRYALRISKPFIESIQVAAARDQVGQWAIPIEARPRLLFNPELTSSHFFVPALVGIILQNVTILLTAFTIVRERELGTLEQLFVTPVGGLGLLLGKLIPYAVLGFIETLIVLLCMVFIFGVPIRGSLFLLLALCMLFIVTALGLGLLVSTVSRTQLQAVQVAFVILLPSILLSGFMFPRDGMPTFIYLISFCIPATYFLDILRGVILRGAELRDLMPSVWGLCACCGVILVASVARFRKQLD